MLPMVFIFFPIFKTKFTIFLIKKSKPVQNNQMYKKSYLDKQKIKVSLFVNSPFLLLYNLHQ